MWTKFYCSATRQAKTFHSKDTSGRRWCENVCRGWKRGARSTKACLEKEEESGDRAKLFLMNSNFQIFSVRNLNVISCVRHLSTWFVSCRVAMLRQTFFFMGKILKYKTRSQEQKVFECQQHQREVKYICKSEKCKIRTYLANALIWIINFIVSFDKQREQRKLFKCRHFYKLICNQKQFNGKKLSKWALWVKKKERDKWPLGEVTMQWSHECQSWH